MAMASIVEVPITLLEFWVLGQTCVPLLECSAPNTFTDRDAHNFAKEITCIMLEMLNQNSIEFQRTMMEKFLHLLSLQPLLPKFVQNQKRIQQCAAVCESIASAWSGLKFGIEKDKYVAQKIVKAIVVSSSGPVSLQATKSCLGMNKRTIQRVFRLKKLLDS